MRIGLAAFAVIVLFLAGPGKVMAQTTEVERTVEMKVALTRLAQGIRIGESIQTLGRIALEEPVEQLQQTGARLREIFDRLRGRIRGKSISTAEGETP